MTLDRDELIARIKRDAERAGSQKALAAKIGVSQPFLSDVIRGARLPGHQILEFYGFKEERVYVKS